MNLFISTYVLVFIAELPDKTAFATLLMATKGRPWAIILGACCAFTIQSFIAVAFGSVFAYLPQKRIHLVAGLLFFWFAWAALRRPHDEKKELESFEAKNSFWRVVGSSLIVIFIAEWGDLTQLATVSLQARYHSGVTIFTAATLSLWTVTCLAVIIGTQTKKWIHPKILNRVAAAAFFCVGVYFAVSGFK